VQTYVAFAAGETSGRSLDQDAPVQTSTAAGGFAHAAAAGSVVALCGTPVRDVTGDPWPPQTQAGCPRCTDALSGMVGSLPQGPGPS
jgi:hypothetical protein